MYICINIQSLSMVLKFEYMQEQHIIMHFPVCFTFLNTQQKGKTIAYLELWIKGTFCLLWVEWKRKLFLCTVRRHSYLFDWGLSNFLLLIMVITFSQFYFIPYDSIRWWNLWGRSFFCRCTELRKIEASCQNGFP